MSGGLSEGCEEGRIDSELAGERGAGLWTIEGKIAQVGATKLLAALEMCRELDHASFHNLDKTCLAVRLRLPDETYVGRYVAKDSRDYYV